MTTISNLRLEIVENQGAAAALVSYRLGANASDSQERRVYTEVIELFGVDEGAGEDGQSELLPGGRVEKLIDFASPMEFDRTQLFALSGTTIDEDRNPAPGAAPLQDEIRARVTHTHIIQPLRVDSNLVRRGL